MTGRAPSPPTSATRQRPLPPLRVRTRRGHRTPSPRLVPPEEHNPGSPGGCRWRSRRHSRRRLAHVRCHRPSPAHRRSSHTRRTRRSYDVTEGRRGAARTGGARGLGTPPLPLGTPARDEPARDERLRLGGSRGGGNHRLGGRRRRGGRLGGRRVRSELRRGLEEVGETVNIRSLQPSGESCLTESPGRRQLYC